MDARLYAETIADIEADRCNLKRELEQIKAVLSDPDAVSVNMLRGTIAKPSIARILHIYGASAIAQEISKMEGPQS